MKQIYVIAQDEMVNTLDGPDTETRVCHNLGAFKELSDAQKVADRHNELVEDDENESESYYVMAMDLT